MVQKIIKIGNSLGVVLPKALLDEVGLGQGSSVELVRKNRYLKVTPKEDITGGVDAKFVKMVDKFSEEHKEALTELAKR